MQTFCFSFANIMASHMYGYSVRNDAFTQRFLDNLPDHFPELLVIIIEPCSLTGFLRYLLVRIPCWRLFPTYHWLRFRHRALHNRPYLANIPWSDVVFTRYSFPSRT